MSDFLSKRRFPAPVDSDAVARDWQARGYSCERFTDPPGREWNNFVHDTNELVTVSDGRLELSFGQQRIVVEPGDEVFIPKGATHSVKNIHAGTTRWLFGYD